jgi:hypothetical protein
MVDAAAEIQEAGNQPVESGVDGGADVGREADASALALDAAPDVSVQTEAGLDAPPDTSLDSPQEASDDSVLAYTSDGSTESGDSSPDVSADGTDAEDAPPDTVSEPADSPSNDATNNADDSADSNVMDLEDLGADLTGVPGAAISSWGPNRLDVWVTGLDQTIWHRACGTAPCKSPDLWSGWENAIGGTIVSRPAAVSWGLGRIDVFGLDSNGSVMHTAYDDGSGWSGWDTYLAGAGFKEIAASSQGEGYLDVFVLRSDGKVEFRQYSPSGWTDWALVPGDGAVTSHLSATSWGAGRIDLGGFSSSHPTMISTQTATVTGFGATWLNLPASPSACNGGTVLTARGGGKLVALCASGSVDATPGGFFANLFDGSWTGWSALHVPSPENVRVQAAVSWSGSRTDMIWMDTATAHLMHGWVE